MADYNSSRRKELSEHLSAWWCKQTDFTTKKVLAGFLGVHPDTVGDYFSGRRFPKSDIADRLYELTMIACLETDSGPIAGAGPEEASPVPRPQPGAAALAERPQEPDITGLSGKSKEKHHFADVPQTRIAQVPKEIPGEGRRDKERSVVISLERTSCPFCGHDITRFRGCGYCGRHFVWARVPIKDGEPE